jgi:HD superfamily phosphohydrolase
MLLVRRLGGDLREQIAALLHDISHTALSHVIDYVFHDHDGQGFHDEKKAWYMGQTDIPEILATFGLDWNLFVDETAYPILEQPAPRLCADRIDYFLRDAQGLGLATETDIRQGLEGLVVADGRIACNDLPHAQWFGRTFMAADDRSWANFHEVGLYECTARAIRRALELDAITEVDFWLTDKEFWQKCSYHPDPELQKWVRLVHPQTEFVWDEAAPTFRISTKLRAIDPDVLVDGQLRPLSTLDQSFAASRAGYLLEKSGRWPMRVVGM